MVDHDGMEDSVAAYVLDACDEDEREAVRTHIEGCTSCRDLVARLTQVADVLPLGSDIIRPPDRLRARILAAAASPAGQAEAGAPPLPRPVSPPVRTSPSRRPVTPGGGWRRVRAPALAAAAGALAVVLLALGAWNVMLNQQLHQPPAHYSMTGTGTLAGATATVTAYRPQDVALVSFTGLPQPAPGRVYELWLINGAGTVAPAGTFTPDAGGAATVQVSGSLAAARGMAVTQEQGPRGSQAPTQKPELAGQLGA
jgi:hypothetical protein